MPRECRPSVPAPTAHTRPSLHSAINRKQDLLGGRPGWRDWLIPLSGWRRVDCGVTKVVGGPLGERGNRGGSSGPCRRPHRGYISLKAAIISPIKCSPPPAFSAPILNLISTSDTTVFFLFLLLLILFFLSSSSFLHYPKPYRAAPQDSEPLLSVLPSFPPASLTLAHRFTHKDPETAARPPLAFCNRIATQTDVYSDPLKKDYEKGGLQVLSDAT